jgi:hypothetical protein
MIRQDSRTRGKLARRKCMVAAGGMLIAFAAAASPASGQTYTLNLSAPPTAAVGQPIIIQATGSNPPTDFFSSWLDVYAIPTGVLSACPAEYLNALQVATSTRPQGGGIITNSLRENVDAAGNFSIPLVHTPTVPGQFLICGYTNDAATFTLATASLLLNVQGSSTPGSGQSPGGGVQSPSGVVQGPGSVGGQGTARPANVGKPRVRRSGRNLVCNRGRWANAPTRFSYAWLVNGKAKKGARRQKLRITRKLRGRRVQCKVTARNAAGSRAAVSRRYRV